MENWPAFALGGGCEVGSGSRAAESLIFDGGHSVTVVVSPVQTSRSMLVYHNLVVIVGIEMLSELLEIELVGCEDWIHTSAQR